MAQDRWTLQREKLVGSQAARTQSLAHAMQVTGNVAGCSHAVQDLLPFKMNAADTTAHELRKCSLRVSSSDTRNERCTDGWMETNTRCTGRHCSPVMRLPTGQSLQHA